MVVTADTVVVAVVSSAWPSSIQRRVKYRGHTFSCSFNTHYLMTLCKMVLPYTRCMASNCEVAGNQGWSCQRRLVDALEECATTVVKSVGIHIWTLKQIVHVNFQRSASFVPTHDRYKLFAWIYNAVSQLSRRVLVNPLKATRHPAR